MPVMGVEEENQFALCDGGLLGVIHQLQSANLLVDSNGNSSSTEQRNMKLKPALAKQVAAAAVKRAKETARNQSPGERQVCRPRVAPLEIKELVLGKLLGVGGFSYVYEIKAFDLSASTAVPAGSNSALQRIGGKSSLKHRPLCYNKAQRKSRQFLSQHAVRSRRERTNRKNYDTTSEEWGSHEEITYRGSESSIDTSERGSKQPLPHSKHVGSAEDSSPSIENENDEQGETTAAATGETPGSQEVPRYAIKHLKRSLLNTPEKFARAAMDLACEAEMLLCLDHPNIVKLRGWSGHGPSSYRSGDNDAYFLVIDRLVETLQDQVYSWRRRWKRIHRRGILEQQSIPTKGPGKMLAQLFQKCLPSRKELPQEHQQQSSSKESSASFPHGSEGTIKEASIHGGSTHCQDYHHSLQQQLDSLLIERLLAANDIASAVEYLHEKRIIYRDLKTTNVGIDIRGNIKLFDFGLSRYLPAPITGEVDEVYTMSHVGTRRYTAPEVTVQRGGAEYNLKADVYSFGVVLWEILSMSSPTAHRICAATGALIEQQTLNSCPCWPLELQNLTSRLLNPEHPKRPTMACVLISLQDVIRNLSVDRAGVSSSLTSMQYTDAADPQDHRLGFSPRQRRRSTFRLDSFNLEDLIEIEDLKATDSMEDSKTASLQDGDQSTSIAGSSITSASWTTISSRS
jgi:serine/threonine protein kinase